MTVGSSGFLFDGDLISALLSDNAREHDRAWQRFYDDNYEIIRLKLNTMGIGQDEFRDIYHDSLAAMLTNLIERRFKGQSKLSTYFYSICYNNACKLLRGRHIKFVDVPAPEEFEVRAEEYDTGQDLLLEQALYIFKTQLKPECHDVLTKYYIHRYTMEQLLPCYNVKSIGAMKNKKLRCMRLFRKLLEETVNPELLKKYVNKDRP